MLCVVNYMSLVLWRPSFRYAQFIILLLIGTVTVPSPVLIAYMARDKTATEVKVSRVSH